MKRRVGSLHIPLEVLHVGMGGAGGDHNILSATHLDSLAASVVRGDLIIGNATPAWSRLAKPGATQFLKSDAVDAFWAAIAHADLTGVTADQHHAQAHALDGANHTLAGSATGRFLRATGATTFAIEAIPISRGGVVLTPVAADHIVWRAPFACTVTAIKGYQDVGTGSTINAFRNTLASPTLFMAANLTVTPAETWVDGGAVQNTAIAAGDKVYIRIATVAGTPNKIGVQIDMTRP